MGDKNFCRNLLTVDQFLNSSLIKAGGREALPLPPVSCWREILKLLDGQRNLLAPLHFWGIKIGIQVIEDWICRNSSWVDIGGRDKSGLGDVKMLLQARRTDTG